MLGNRITGIQMSRRTLNSFINGRHIIMFETAQPFNTLRFTARPAITMIECTPLPHPRIRTLMVFSVPLHSFKFVAALQHAAGKSNRAPLLLRHHLKAGHGAGKPTQKVIEEASERFAFMMNATGTKFLERKKEPVGCLPI